MSQFNTSSKTFGWQKYITTNNGNELSTISACNLDASEGNLLFATYEKEIAGIFSPSDGSISKAYRRMESSSPKWDQDNYMGTTLYYSDPFFYVPFADTND